MAAPGGDRREAERACAEAAAAVADFDYGRAMDVLAAARARAPEDGALLAAWIRLCVDGLGDDGAALEAVAGRESLPGPEDRARLLLAAARSDRIDAGRVWASRVEAVSAPEAVAAWLGALLRAGAIEEAEAQARRVRLHPVRAPVLRAALARVDEATAPLRRAARAREVEELRQGEQVTLDGVELEGRAGRWEGARAALLSLGMPRTEGLRARWQLLVDEAEAAIAHAVRRASEARVEQAGRALAAGPRAEGMQAFVALSPEERGRVDPSLVPEVLAALLDRVRARPIEAVEAALAYESAQGLEGSARWAVLRPHAALLRRVEAARALLESAARAAQPLRAEAVELREEPRLVLVRGAVQSLAARGALASAWGRAADEPALAALASELRAELDRATAFTEEPAVEGDLAEMHAELLRGDAAVVRLSGTLVALSVDEGLATMRRFDAARGGVVARAGVDLGRPFEVRATRGDARWLGLASHDAVASFDRRDGALRSLWTVPDVGILGPRLHACGDPDFAWVHGRDETGARVARVIDLARGEVIRAFGCDDAIEVRGGTDLLTLDLVARQMFLRDAHGVTVIAVPFEEEASLLAVVAVPRVRGAIGLLRVRHPQTAEDRRRARPPHFTMVLVSLRAGQRGATRRTLREAARDETGALAWDTSRGCVWARLGPDDLPGELLALRVDDLATVASRTVPAGVGLHPAGAGASLEFLSARAWTRSDDPARDPPIPPRVAPLGVHPPRWTQILPCAPGPTEEAWHAHAVSVRGCADDAGAVDAIITRHRRAPAMLLGLSRVLSACDRPAVAETVITRARALHPDYGPLRLEAAQAAWRRGEVGAVRALLEGASLLGLGDELVHARHLLGLARMAEGDASGAVDAWREGLSAPLPRVLCGLDAILAAVSAARGAKADGACVIAVALADEASAAARAARDPGLCARRARRVIEDPHADAHERRRAAAALASVLGRASSFSWCSADDAAEVLSRMRPRPGQPMPP